MAPKKQLILELPASQIIHGASHLYKSNVQFAVSGSQVVLYCLESRVQDFKLSKGSLFVSKVTFDLYIYLIVRYID